MPENFEARDEGQNQEKNPHPKPEKSENADKWVEEAISEMKVLRTRDMDISRNLKIALAKSGIRDVRQLTEMSGEDLESLKGVIGANIDSIRSALAKMDLKLKGDKIGESKDILSKRIDTLDFFKSQYTVAISKLKRFGINTVGDLANTSAEELLKISSFGPGKVNIIRHKLAELGLKLKGE